jgi:hypothetical protein
MSQEKRSVSKKQPLIAARLGGVHDSLLRVSIFLEVSDRQGNKKFC